MFRSTALLRPLTLALCAAGIMSAGTITVTAINPLPPLNNYKTDGLNNAIGPYQLTTSIGNLTVTCLDIALETGSSTTPYNAYQTTAFQAANTTETQTYTPGTTLLYEQEAYLFSQLLTASNTTTQAEIQDAIWALANSSFHSTLNSHNVIGNSDYTQAHGALAYYNSVTGMSQTQLQNAVDQNDYVILSQVPGSGPQGSNNQEFIYYNPDGPSPSPEPASIGLMGGALLVFGVFGRRFLKSEK